MALSTTHPALRWAVPGAVVAIVLGAATITSVAADQAPTLQPRTAAELLVDVQNASVSTMYGTVVQTADLGLPELPVQVGGQGSSDFTSLVSGTHTLRVWYDGDDQQRLALLGTLGESDIVRNGTDVWTWNSEDNTATHYQLPTRPEGAAAPVPDPSVPAYTPQQAADAALAAIDPSTNVSTDGTAKVAGRAAYELVLTPKDDRSLVGAVRIAIDGEKHIPLRVQVTAKGAAAPAFEVGFTQISFDTPDPKQFTFTPPPGATVTDSTLGEGAEGQAEPDATQPVPTSPADALDPTGEPTIVGTGWTSVLVATMPTAPAEAAAPTADAPPTAGAPPTADGSSTASDDGSRSAGNPLESILGSLPQVSGAWGSGRLLKSALFSVLLTDDGRVIAGAVAPELLFDAAAR